MDGMESSAEPRVKPPSTSVQEDYLRSAMFGLQDGLVSTTGVVVGISAGVDDKEVVVLAAFVAVMVEATSMAAGQYSSEKSVHQMDRTGRHTDSLIIGAGIMFLAYLIGGLFPIVPTILLGRPEAQIVAVLAAFAGLFIVGYLKGKFVDEPPLRSGIELFVIGAVATSIGLAVGYFLKV
jgi:VIT1/CCC1 family predicted Fe2+/Mn2+ transporter